MSQPPTSGPTIIGSTTVSVKKFAPTRIDVRTLVPGQIVEIVPDPAALAAALAELKD